MKDETKPVRENDWSGATSYFTDESGRRDSVGIMDVEKYVRDAANEGRHVTRVPTIPFKDRQGNDYEVPEDRVKTFLSDSVSAKREVARVEEWESPDKRGSFPVTLWPEDAKNRETMKANGWKAPGDEAEKPGSREWQQATMHAMTHPEDWQDVGAESVLRGTGAAAAGIALGAAGMAEEAMTTPMALSGRISAGLMDLVGKGVEAAGAEKVGQAIQKTSDIANRGIDAWRGTAHGVREKAKDFIIDDILGDVVAQGTPAGRNLAAFGVGAAETYGEMGLGMRAIGKAGKLAVPAAFGTMGAEATLEDPSVQKESGLKQTALATVKGVTDALLGSVIGRIMRATGASGASKPMQRTVGQAIGIALGETVEGGATMGGMEAVNQAARGVLGIEDAYLGKDGKPTFEIDEAAMHEERDEDGNTVQVPTLVKASADIRVKRALNALGHGLLMTLGMKAAEMAPRLAYKGRGMTQAVSYDVEQMRKSYAPQIAQTARAARAITEAGGPMLKGGMFGNARVSTNGEVYFDDGTVYYPARADRDVAVNGKVATIKGSEAKIVVSDGTILNEKGDVVGKIAGGQRLATGVNTKAEWYARMTDPDAANRVTLIDRETGLASELPADIMSFAPKGYKAYAQWLMGVGRRGEGSAGEGMEKAPKLDAESLAFADIVRQLHGTGDERAAAQLALGDIQAGRKTAREAMETLWAADDALHGNDLVRTRTSYSTDTAAERAQEANPPINGAIVVDPGTVKNGELPKTAVRAATDLSEAGKLGVLKGETVDVTAIELPESAGQRPAVESGAGEKVEHAGIFLRLDPETGKLVPVDGAKRIAAEKASGAKTVEATVLRAEDGWTPENAEAVKIVGNLTTGTIGAKEMVEGFGKLGLGLEELREKGVFGSGINITGKHARKRAAWRVSKNADGELKAAVTEDNLEAIDQISTAINKTTWGDGWEAAQRAAWYEMQDMGALARDRALNALVAMRGVAGKEIGWKDAVEVARYYGAHYEEMQKEGITINGAPGFELARQKMAADGVSRVPVVTPEGEIKTVGEVEAARAGETRTEGTGRSEDIGKENPGLEVSYRESDADGSTICGVARFPELRIRAGGGEIEIYGMDPSEMLDPRNVDDMVAVVGNMMKLANEKGARLMFEPGAETAAEVLMAKVEQRTEPEWIEREKAVMGLLEKSGLAKGVVTDKETFDAVLGEAGGKRLVADGMTYGYVVGGKVYLNPDFFGSTRGLNTKLHEFGHLAWEKTKTANRALYDRGMELAGKLTDQIEEMRKSAGYDQYTDEQLKEELVVKLIGDRGTSLEGKVEKTVLGEIKAWVDNVWKSFGKALGIREITAEQAANMTIEEVADAVRAEMLSGKLFGSRKGGGRSKTKEQWLNGEKGVLSEYGKKVLGQTKRAVGKTFIRNSADGMRYVDKVVGISKNGGLQLVSDIYDASGKKVQDGRRWTTFVTHYIEAFEAMDKNPKATEVVYGYEAGAKKTKTRKGRKGTVKEPKDAIQPGEESKAFNPTELLNDIGKSMSKSDQKEYGKLEREYYNAKSYLEEVEATNEDGYSEYTPGEKLAARNAVKSAQQNLETFAEQARRYYGAPRDAEGRPIMLSVSPVYTGSAADYEKPSLVHVGSGEGSQVYGWGLYGSGVRGVAEGYSNILSKQDDFYYVAAGSMNQASGNREKAIRLLREEIRKYENSPYKKVMPEDYAKKRHDAIEYIEKGGVFNKGIVYSQTFFTNRAPGDESHLLNWYEPVSKENWQRIISSIKKTDGWKEKLDSTFATGWQNKSSYADSEEVYNYFLPKVINELYGKTGTPKEVSEFLARADIDGIKYPVDSYGGNGVKDGDKVGWNYVSFRDDNIRVDHKWRDGEMLFSRPAVGFTAGRVRVANDEGRGERTPGMLAASHELSTQPNTPIRMAGQMRKLSLPLSELEWLRQKLTGSHVPAHVAKNMPGGAASASTRSGKLVVAADVFGIVDQTDAAAQKQLLKRGGYFRNEDPAWAGMQPPSAIRAERRRSEEQLANQLAGIADRRVRGTQEGGQSAARGVFADELARIVMEMPHVPAGTGLGRVRTIGEGVRRAIVNGSGGNFDAARDEAGAFLDWAYGAPRAGAPATRDTEAVELTSRMFGAFLVMPGEMEARAPRWCAEIRNAICNDAKLLDAFRELSTRAVSEQATDHLMAQVARGLDAQTERTIAQLESEGREPIKAGGWMTNAKEGIYVGFDDRAAPVAVRIGEKAKIYRRAKKAAIKAERDPAVRAQLEAELNRFEGTLGAAINKMETSRLAFERGSYNEGLAYFTRELMLVNEATERWGLTLDDMAAYLDFKRVIETQGRASSYGMSARQAEIALEKMERKLGPQKWGDMQRFAGQWWTIHEQEFLRDPRLKAAFGQKFVDYLETQSHYVTTARTWTPEQLADIEAARTMARRAGAAGGDDIISQVYSFGSHGGAFGRSGEGLATAKLVGSFAAKKNVMAATWEKIDHIQQMLRKNQFAMDLRDALVAAGVEGVRDMARGNVDFPENARYGRINYMQDGQKRTLIVPRQIKDGFERDAGTSAFLNGILNLRGGWRKVIIDYNPAYWNRNINRNIGSLEKNMPGMKESWVKTLLRPLGAGNVSDAILMHLVRKFGSDGGIIGTILGRDTVFALAPKAKRMADLIENPSEWQRRLWAADDAGDAEAVATMRADLDETLRMLRTNMLVPTHVRNKNDSAGFVNDVLGSKGLKTIARIREEYDAKGKTRRAVDAINVFEKNARQQQWEDNHAKIIGYLHDRMRYGSVRTEKESGLTVAENVSIAQGERSGRNKDKIQGTVMAFFNMCEKGFKRNLKAHIERPGEMSVKDAKVVIGATLGYMVGNGVVSAVLLKMFDDDENKLKESAFGGIYDYAESARRACKNMSNYVRENFNALPLWTSKSGRTSIIFGMPWNDEDKVLVPIAQYIAKRTAARMGLPVSEPGAGETAFKATAKAVTPDLALSGPEWTLLRDTVVSMFVENPTDFFSGAKLFDKDLYEARSESFEMARKFGWEVAKRVWNDLGGRVILQADRNGVERTQGEEVPELVSDVLSKLPIVSPFLRSFIKIQQGSIDKYAKPIDEIEKKRNAIISVLRKEAIKKHADDPGWLNNREGYRKQLDEWKTRYGLSWSEVEDLDAGIVKDIEDARQSEREYKEEDQADRIKDRARKQGLNPKYIID